MTHFKKIRRSLKGRNIPPRTRSWLYQKRLEEMDLERRLEKQVGRAKADGRCTAFIMPKAGTETMYKSDPPSPGRLCGATAFRRGYCTDHFITHILHLPDRKSGAIGKGVSARPFAAYQFPVGRLSPLQEDLMADLVRLPMDTSRQACLARLNEEDPANTLELPARLRLTKKRAAR